MVEHTKSLILILFLVYTINGDNVQWREFKIKYKKTYATNKEEFNRYKIFLENLQLIEKHNERFHRNEVKYELGVTRFADMSQEEIFSSGHMKSFSKKGRKNANIPRNFVSLPESLDWREKGAVTEVKDSGECVKGSWAFAAAATLESRLYILNETLVSLSAQNLLDCDKYSMGCQRGEMDSAFIYIRLNGITTEEKYPFTGEEKDCNKNEDDIVYKSNVQEWDEDEEVLCRTIGEFGPVGVIIDGACLFLYKSGIIEQDCGCVNDYYKYDMNTVVVGYGKENDTDFWILKHAWGTDWGEEGYFRLRRNNNTCGIGNQFYLAVDVH